MTLQRPDSQRDSQRIVLLFLPKAITTVPLSFVLLQCVYQGILAASLAALLFAYAIHNIGPQRATLLS